MATTARGIVYPVVGNTLTPLANHFAALATSTNTALDNLAAYNRGLDSAKGAAGTEGRTYFSTDTNRWWFDDGTNWVSIAPGEVAIYPTSVVGGTAQGDGSVTFSGVASVSLNGVFTSRFRSYRVKWSIDSRTVTGGTGVENLRLRAGGTDASGANYGWKRFVSSGASISNAASTTDTSWSSMASTGYAQSDKTVRLERPNTAVATRITDCTGSETDGANIETVVGYSGYHTLATAYDGITLFVSAGNMTGSISVHGIA